MLAKRFGAGDPKGAEIAIVNFLADLGTADVTPELVAAVCVRYGVPAGQVEQVTYSILDATAEKYLKRDELTEEGQRLLPELAASLGITQPEVERVVASLIRSRKRAREKTRRARAASPEPSSPTPADVGPAPVRCPKCGSGQLTGFKSGFGLGKAAAGGLLFGPVGLLAGLVGSNAVKVTCLKCGHSWTPGL
jgi:tellurium resistance protein TerD